MISEAANEARQPVLLLHSSGMSSRQWKSLSHVIGRTHRVIAPDLLGSGDNPPWPPDQPFDLAQDVDVIEQLVRSLGQTVHVVGHSYGGLLAVTLARRVPMLIRSLAAYDPVAFGVLVAASDQEGLADLERAGRNPVFTDARVGGSDAWFEVFVDYWNGPGAWRGMSDSGRESFLRVGRKVFLEVMSLIRDQTPGSAYANVEAPALFLGGELSPPAARRVVALLAKAFPNGRLLQVHGAGHMGPLTHGAVVNAAIVAHIASAS
jgi:pimeloyl-ACP methyl ester carboxylesterase